MKKKLFSRGLYTEALRQLRITGIIFLVICLFAGIIVPTVGYINYASYEDPTQYPPSVVEFIEMCPTVVGVFTVCALVFTLALFGSFNKRNASDFYHSLPYTRSCMFFSFTAAIFTWIIGISLVSCAATIGVYFAMPQVYIVNLAGAFDILLTCFAASLSVVFGVIAAMSITGTPIANVTATGLILFFPRLIVTVYTFALGCLAPIIDGHFGFLNSEYNVLVNMVLNLFGINYNEPFKNNYGADIYSIFIGLAYGAIALILFINRKSETAGQAAPGRKVQAAIRICVALVISLIVTTILMDDFDIAIAVVFYTIAILAYFIYELITTKSFKNLLRAVPGLAIVVALNIAFVAGCYGTSMVVHSYTPDADQVSAIYIKGNEINYSYQVDFSEYATNAASYVKIDDEEAIKYACKSLEQSAQRSKEGKFYTYTWYDEEIITKEELVNYYDLSLTFISNNGVERSRNIIMPETDYVKFMEAITSNEAYKEKFYEIPEELDRTISVRDLACYADIALTDEEEAKVLDMMREEILKVEFSKITTEFDKYDSSVFELTYQTKEDGTKLRLRIPLNSFPETNEYLIEKVNSANLEKAEVIYEILSDVDAARAENENYSYWHISMKAYKESQLHWELWGVDHGYSNEDNTIADLGEKMEAGTFDYGNFTIVTFECEEMDENLEYTKFNTYTLFLPYPDGFEPDPDYFSVRDFNEEIYYEEYIID